jgi:hypothetical protein
MGAKAVPDAVTARKNAAIMITKLNKKHGAVDMEEYSHLLLLPLPCTISTSLSS